MDLPDLWILKPEMFRGCDYLVGAPCYGIPEFPLVFDYSGVWRKVG